MFVCITYHVHAWCPRRSQEGTRVPRIGVTDSVEPPCDCCNPCQGPLQEQQLSLTSENLSSLFILFLKLSSTDSLLFFLYFFVFFLGQGFSVVLDALLEVALVDQAGLELTEICLPLPPEWWD